MVFHWCLSDNKSPQVSRTRLSILPVLSNAVVWIVSTRPPTSKSSRPFNNPLVIVPLKENSEFKPVKLRLQKIDLVSYPARAEGLGKYDEPLGRWQSVYRKSLLAIVQGNYELY